MSQNLQNLQNFVKFQKFQFENLVDFEKMLQNAYLLAKIGADTADNERTLAEHFQKLATTLTGPLPHVPNVPRHADHAAGVPQRPVSRSGRHLPALDRATSETPRGGVPM